MENAACVVRVRFHRTLLVLCAGGVHSGLFTLLFTRPGVADLDDFLPYDDLEKIEVAHSLLKSSN